MIVRAAVPADAPTIAEIWNLMIRDTLFTFTNAEKTLPEIKAMIASRPAAFWVADLDGMAGFVTYAQFRAGPGYRGSLEHSIVLTDAAKGKGVGRALMEKALRSAVEQGHHVMVAGISAANPAGVAFHTRLGFAHVGRMHEVGQKRGQWLDLILMQKMLSSP